MSERQEFGPQHVYALARARGMVLKDADRFSIAHERYNAKGMFDTARQMMDCNTACFQVAKFLKELIEAAKGEREPGND